MTSPPAVRTSTSLMASSAALRTIRSTVSCTVDVDRHRPRKGGRSHVGLDLNPVDVGLHGPGQAKGVLVGRRWGRRGG